MSNLPRLSSSRLVLMPSYNTGPQLLEAVRAALRVWQPVWVILDGCTDRSKDALVALESTQSTPLNLRIIELSRNQGKGAAVLAGMRAAREAGFSHALVMDADGQHPATSIPEFMELSERHPTAMILGEPKFADDAPFARQYGRCVGNWWANLETLWGGVKDSLFGFRVYPIMPSLRVLESISGARRYDFDTVLAVRLCWLGVSPISVKVPVKYLSKVDGGISHFRYCRDNLLLIRAHSGLVFGMLTRLPALWRKRTRT
jgi:glycosyltransferase involved in cell wall biosynthesis